MTTLVCSAVSSWFRSFWTFAGQNFGAAGRFDRQGRVGFRPRRKHFPISSKTTGVLCSPVRRNVMCATQLKEAGFTTSNVDSAGLFLHQLRKWAPLKRRMAFQTYRTPPARPPARTHLGDVMILNQKAFPEEGGRCMSLRRVSAPQRR